MNNLSIIPSSELILSASPATVFDGVMFGDEQASRWTEWMEAFYTWLDQKRQKSGGPNTASAYKTAFSQFFKVQYDQEGLVLWQPVAPWNVTPRIALSWATFLSHMGKEVKDRHTGQLLRREPLARASINQKLAAMSSFYSFVQKNYDLIPADKRNPFDAVERGKVSVYGRAKYPDQDEIGRIMRAINTDCLTGKRDIALLYTILTTCRRSSEILNLRWGDLRQGQNGQYVFAYRYKGGAVKQANLGPRAYTLICEYLRADGRLETIGEDDFIFIALDEERVKRLRPEAEINPNQAISNSLANRILKKYARRAGVPTEKAHIHALRHAGARQRVADMKAGKGGVDYEQIMDLLGHSSLAVTQIYVHSVAMDPEDQGLDAAEQAFLPKGGKRRRAKRSAGEQLPLDPKEREIAELRARLAELEGAEPKGNGWGGREVA